MNNWYGKILWMLLAPAVAMGVTNTVTPELLQKLRANDGSLSSDETKISLLQLGDMHDTNVVPLLRMYLSKSDIRRPSGIVGCAQIALAKLNDPEAFSEIMQEINSADEVHQSDAFIKLGMVGNKEAVRLLGHYLFVDKPAAMQAPWVGPHGEKPQDAPWYFPPSYLAARALATILGDASPTRTHPLDYRNEDIEKWRQWWQENKSKFDSPNE